jgi:hypothetical protein
MSVKTPLEKDIERLEKNRKPISLFILIILLSLSLIAVGGYTAKLKQELSEKEQEIVLTKERTEKEKNVLLSEIKALEKERDSLKTEVNVLTGKLDKLSKDKSSRTTTKTKKRSK